MKDASDHEPRWRDLFEKQRAKLEEAASMIAYREEDPKTILSSAINLLKDRPFDPVFGPVSAVREVIKAAIARNDEGSEEESALAPQQWQREGPLPLEALPWAERTVYFLREVQHYGRRDTALLLAMSDWEVDQLNTSAKKRMGFPEERSKRELHGCRTHLFELGTQLHSPFMSS